jgi:hypothetical protein
VFGALAPSEQAQATPYGEPWHIFGGHRLWLAPEHPERSYYPDNRPVQIRVDDPCVHLVQEVESVTQVQKSLVLTLHPASTRVSVEHRLRNCGSEALELAPWALTVMARGGRALFPQPPFRPHPQALAPARPLVLWPFTRMQDPRWSWGDRFVSLEQDPSRPGPQKLGLYDPCAYMAYFVEGCVFLKCHLPTSGRHADFGCNVEAFVNGDILELETLGPLVWLAPGQTVSHREEWFLFRTADPGTSQAQAARNLRPLLESIARSLGAADPIAACLTRTALDALPSE